MPRQLRSVVLTSALLALLGGASSHAWDSRPEKAYEGWPHIVKDIPRFDYSADTLVPVKATFKHFLITVSESADQEGAGSGGRIMDITVRDIKAGTTLAFEEQWAGGRILDEYNGYPQIEVWGRGGGGTYSRILCRVQHGHYLSIRDDLFDLNIDRASRRDITASLPGSTETLYYTGTMYPTPGTGE